MTRWLLSKKWAIAPKHVCFIDGGIGGATRQDSSCPRVRWAGERWVQMISSASLVKETLLRIVDEKALESDEVLCQ